MITKTLQLVILFLSLAIGSYADEPPPDCDNPDTPCEEAPVDSNLIILVVAGGLFGLKALKSNKEKHLVPKY